MFVDWRLGNIYANWRTNRRHMMPFLNLKDRYENDRDRKFETIKNK